MQIELVGMGPIWSMDGGSSGIYPTAFETLFQMYELHDSGGRGDVIGALDARSPPSRLRWACSPASVTVRTHRLSYRAVVNRK
jgi:hypothetical protein